MGSLQEVLDVLLTRDEQDKLATELAENIRARLKERVTVQQPEVVYMEETKKKKSKKHKWSSEQREAAAARIRAWQAKKKGAAPASTAPKLSGSERAALHALSTGRHWAGEIASTIATGYGIPRTQQILYALVKKGFASKPKPGYFEITDAGREILKQNSVAEDTKMSAEDETQEDADPEMNDADESEEEESDEEESDDSEDAEESDELDGDDE